MSNVDAEGAGKSTQCVAGVKGMRMWPRRWVRGKGHSCWCGFMGRACYSCRLHGDTAKGRSLCCWCGERTLPLARGHTVEVVPLMGKWVVCY